MKSITVYLLLIILILTLIILRILLDQDAMLKSIEHNLAVQNRKITTLCDALDVESDVEFYEYAIRDAESQAAPMHTE